MAIRPQSNEAFLREVNEELRRDQLASFWERYGRWLIVGILVALAMLGGWLYWQHRREHVAGVEGERLADAYRALGQQKIATAQPILADLARSKRPGNRAAALATEGDILLEKKNTRAAAAKFAAIANDPSIGQPLRDLALVRQTAAEFDALKPQVVVERLRPLAVKGNAFFGSAGEMVAMAQLRMGRRDLAGQLFGQIANDPDVPATIRQRAVQMAGATSVDAIALGKDGKAS